MNQINNKRRRESQERIEKVFVQLIQNKEIYQVSVTEICKLAKINRTTFYANYIDVYDLADKIREKMINDLNDECVRMSKIIDTLIKQNKMLMEFLKESPVKPLSEETRPPHY